MADGLTAVGQRSSMRAAVPFKISGIDEDTWALWSAIFKGLSKFEWSSSAPLKHFLTAGSP